MSPLIVEIAGVFNRNLISLRGLVFAIALLEHFPGYTHRVNVCKFGSGGKEVLVSWACDSGTGSMMDRGWDTVLMLSFQLKCWEEESSEGSRVPIHGIISLNPLS